ncbi:MAG: phospho-N-acetylmuramoyl-pentapeptide-transferase, partial [Cyanobacteria bacterium]|nr:phospho-N-acetylmuramoyl-pentapeptide-transferase [Cyanobacteriota bacterium]
MPVPAGATAAPADGRSSALALAVGLLIACLVCDGLSGAPQLTPPLLVAGLVSWALCRWGVPRLRSLKLGQVIREEGPQGHHGKAGTPTMGGLLAVPVGVIVGG